MDDNSLYYMDPEGVSKFRIVCAYPAPLVVNGGGFAGCQLDKGHTGQHSITITWGEE